MVLMGGGEGLSSESTIFTCRLGLLFWMKGRAYLDICCYIMKYYSEVLKEDQWCYFCLSNKILFGLIFKKYFLVSQSNCLYILVMKYHVIVWGQSVFNFAPVVRFLKCASRDLMKCQCQIKLRSWKQVEVQIKLRSLKQVEVSN